MFIYNLSLNRIFSKVAISLVDTYESFIYFELAKWVLCVYESLAIFLAQGVKEKELVTILFSIAIKKSIPISLELFRFLRLVANSHPRDEVRVVLTAITLLSRPGGTKTTPLTSGIFNKQLSVRHSTHFSSRFALSSSHRPNIHGWLVRTWIKKICTNVCWCYFYQNHSSKLL